MNTYVTDAQRVEMTDTERGAGGGQSRDGERAGRAGAAEGVSKGARAAGGERLLGLGEAGALPHLSWREGTGQLPHRADLVARSVLLPPAPAQFKLPSGDPPQISLAFKKTNQNQST